ncbi:MAG TPA: hypothetical protein VE984_02820 [Gaiellaceae bacterium]|nr:hypothetical protein [Gaiellaceae bacterium]
MKRFLMLVGVAVVAAAMYVAASPAGRQAAGPTARQYKALKKQVTTLSKTVKGLKTAVTTETKLLAACVKFAIPINQFGNPHPTDTSTPEGYEYGKGPFGNGATPTTEFFTTGLDVSTTTDPGAVWFIGGDASCGALVSPTGALRHAAAKAGIRLPHAAVHAPSFVAHQP